VVFEDDDRQTTEVGKDRSTPYQGLTGAPGETRSVLQTSTPGSCPTTLILTASSQTATCKTSSHMECAAGSEGATIKLASSDRASNLRGGSHLTPRSTPSSLRSPGEG
jgi:hypothetical protein